MNAQAELNFNIQEPKQGTQHYEILRYLRQGNSLTGMDALRLFGTMKLATRISELKKTGYDIKVQMIKTDNGKHIARYTYKEEAR